MKSGPGRFTSLCLLLMVFVSGKAVARPLDPISSVERDGRLHDLVSPTGAIMTATDEDEDWLGCLTSDWQLKMLDPVSGHPREVTMRVRRPADATGKVPFVVLVPTIEGASILESYVANQFCSNGMGVIVADVNDNVPPKRLPSWGIEDNNSRFATGALRAVLDFAELNPNFDKNKFAMMGLSLGGITTAMMAGVEPDRLKAVVITVGGGNLPFILANSDSSKVLSFRLSRMNFLGWDDPVRYEEELRTNVKFDPYYFAPLAKTDRIFMVMAESDTKVPYVVQQEQFEAFGKPNSMLFQGGHVSSILGLSFLYMDSVIDFMTERFTDHKGALAIRPRVHKVIDLDRQPLKPY